VVVISHRLQVAGHRLQAQVASHRWPVTGRKSHAQGDITMEKTAQSYLDLEIYQLAKKLAVEIHRMTLDELPKFEVFEEGSQISGFCM
jgi:hypothetical protein